MKARAATQRIINAEKTAARKLATRKKVIWGSALKTASRDNPNMLYVMSLLVKDGYISESDLKVVKDDLISSDNNN